MGRSVVLTKVTSGGSIGGGNLVSYDLRVVGREEKKYIVLTDRIEGEGEKDVDNTYGV